MTRFIHDQFAKDYLEELLAPFGEVKAFGGNELVAQALLHELEAVKRISKQIP